MQRNNSKKVCFLYLILFSFIQIMPTAVSAEWVIHWGSTQYCGYVNPSGINPIYEQCKDIYEGVKPWRIEPRAEGGCSCLRWESCPANYEYRLGACKAYCNGDAVWDATLKSCEDPPEQKNCKTHGKNPIDFIQGRKYRMEPVLESGITQVFSMHYLYNNKKQKESTVGGHIDRSTSAAQKHSFTAPSLAEFTAAYFDNGLPRSNSLESQYYGSITQYWRHSFDEVLQIRGAKYIYHTFDSQRILFNGFGVSFSYPNLKLQALVEGEEDFSGFKLINTQNVETRKFDSSGRLMKIERSPQDVLTLEYDAQNRLNRIVNSEGAFIQLEYQSLTIDSTYSLASTTHDYPVIVTNNRGEMVKIDWNKSFKGETARFHLLTRITLPSAGTPQTAREFAYNDSRWPASITDMYFVTDIALGLKQLTHHFEYDAQGRAVLSALAEGREAESVTYVDENTRVVTNALGKQATYHFADYSGVKRLQSVTGQPTQNCVSSEVEYQYFANGNVQRKIQNGQVTEYQYDSQNRETLRTEASGTPQARTISTEYHPTLNLPTRITEPGRVEVMTYDTGGRLLSRQIQPTNPPAP